MSVDVVTADVLAWADAYDGPHTYPLDVRPVAGYNWHMPYKDPEARAECKRRWYLAHREERKAAERRRYHEKHSSIQDYQMRYKYGIGLEEYETMLAAQGGQCAICGSTKSSRKSDRMHIDHDHETGRVRGLICHRCNTALGLAREDTNILRKMVAYLER